MYNKHLRNFERELGMPSGEVYIRLMKEESEWAFRRSNCMRSSKPLRPRDRCDAGPSELRRYVERLNVGGQLGKLAFAKDLGAIDAKHERFIKALTKGFKTTRQYDVRNVSVQFDGYVDGYLKDARQTFQRSSRS